VVILSSVSDQDDWMVRAIRAGAVSYIVKSAEVERLIQAIRHAAAGEVSVSQRVAARLMQEVQSPHHLRLTERERAVLCEIASGRTDKEIARSLTISLSTVKTHVRSILDKLDVDSRTQAVVYVLRHNLFSLDDLRVA
jgi:DNA-binding NarL/FixJ family response regulator